jgi:hypothetical protein
MEEEEGGKASFPRGEYGTRPLSVGHRRKKRRGIAIE